MKDSSYNTFIFEFVKHSLVAQPFYHSMFTVRKWMVCLYVTCIRFTFDLFLIFYCWVPEFSVQEEEIDYLLCVVPVGGKDTN